MLIAQNLDHKSAGRMKIKRPRIMDAARRFDIKAVVFQFLIDLVDLRFAFLNKTQMKARRILDFGFAARLHQRENEIVLAQQNRDFVVAFGDRSKSKVFLHKFLGCGHIANGKVDMVEFHENYLSRRALVCEFAGDVADAEWQHERAGKLTLEALATLAAFLDVYHLRQIVR